MYVGGTYIYVHPHTEARGIKRIDITDPGALQIVNNTPPSDYLTNISAPCAHAISPPASGKREQRGPLCNCGGYVTWTSLRWECGVCAAPAKVDGSIDAASTACEAPLPVLVQRGSRCCCCRRTHVSTLPVLRITTANDTQTFQIPSGA